MTPSDVYQQVTDRIIQALEAGTAVWRKPWTSSEPVNVRNGRSYRGINIFLLTFAGYSDPRWGTYKAIGEAGGQVRKGEKATSIILWKPVQRRRSEQAADGEQELGDSYMLLRTYSVFNAEQAENLPPLPEGREHQPYEQAEEIVREYVPGPDIRWRGSQACYSQLLDLVNMPAPESFFSQDAYYSTLFHELVHSTGHESRLDRLEKTHFGSNPYSKEELVAEMGAAMLCGLIGLENLDQSASYIAGWLSRLLEDSKLIIQAAAMAQRACDLMLGKKFEDSQVSENREEVAVR